MLKHQSKDELIEIIYRLDTENEQLKKCNTKQSETLIQLSDCLKPKSNLLLKIFYFFILPFQVSVILKSRRDYFYQLINLNKMKSFSEEQILSALETINAYENKAINPKEYKEFISEMLGIKGICDTCADVMKRLHNDFQKRIGAEIKKKYSYLVEKIEFKSGKYSSSKFYSERIPFYPYEEIRKVLFSMKRDVKIFAQRGLKQQSNLVKQDAETLEKYLNEKLNGVSEETETPEPKTPETKTKEIEAIENGKIEASKETPEETKEVLSEINEPISTEAKNEPVVSESPEWDDAAAFGMKEQGMKLKEIAEYYGVASSTASGRIKKYAENQAKNK